MAGPALTVTVRPMSAADAEAVFRIYQVGLDGGQASVETSAHEWEVFVRGRPAEHRPVAVFDDLVVGWAAVSRVSARPQNTASLRRHQRVELRIVGSRERIGCHHGHWRDGRLIERRSSVAGTEAASRRLI